MSTFGQLLRDYRSLSRHPKSGKPLTQAKLAELIDYSDKTISNWESDRGLPSRASRQIVIEIITILADYNGIDSAEQANRLLQSAGFAQLTFLECTKAKLQQCQPGAAAVSSNSHPYTPQLLTNIWYTQRTYSYTTLWRDYEIGYLTVYQESLHYSGEKTALIIASVENIEHARQTGDINANWVKVTHISDGQKKIAWFAQANRLGIGGIIGGSYDLFNTLWHWFHSP